ncbi:MAG: hypothetical protein JNL70_12420 [Saprospiraceae bacterium]|nr:hypothetical protein [Saprospiraceae bacterium]
MKTKSSNTIESLKWGAQIVGFATTAGLLFFTFAEVLPGISHGRAAMVIPMLPLLALGIIGYFVSWYRELAGGSMLLAGGLSSVLYILLTIKNQEIAFIMGVPLTISGILYLIHWSILYGKHHRHS